MSCDLQMYRGRSLSLWKGTSREICGKSLAGRWPETYVLPLKHDLMTYMYVVHSPPVLTQPGYSAHEKAVYAALSGNLKQVGRKACQLSLVESL